jgi:hypothetical protein
MEASTTVGIYDEEGCVAEDIGTRYAAEHTFVMMRSVSGRGDQILVDKEFLLDRSTCLVIVLSSVRSISVLVGAVRRLLSSQVKGVFVISEHDISPLLATTADSSESSQIEQLVSDGRLVSTKRFIDDEFSRWLSVVGQRM